MGRKFVSLVKAFFSGEEEEKEEKEGFINIVTPELQTRFNFNGDEDLDCSIKRVNGRIEIKFGRKEEDY